MIEKYFVKQAYKSIEMEKFFESKLSKAGFNSIDVVKTPVATRVTLKVAKPGLAIGYSGKNIKYLSEKLEKDFGLKNPHIEVKGIDHPEHDVKHKVASIVSSLEKGNNWRQVVYKAVADLSNISLMGFELTLKGVLMGRGTRKAKYRVPLGYMKKGGSQTRLVLEAKGSAYTKAGAIGVTLKLIPPGTEFPDKISKEDIMTAAQKVFRGVSDEEKATLQSQISIDDDEDDNNEEEQ